MGVELTALKTRNTALEKWGREVVQELHPWDYYDHKELYVQARTLGLVEEK